MKVMKIDENYSINMEDSNNFTLEYKEVKKVIDKEGVSKDVTSRSTYHYPSVFFCLKRYLELSQRDAADVQECIKITQECYERLSKLKFE